MKVVITGANGLLGSFLTEFLRDDFEVYPFGKDDLDITDLNIVEKRIEEINPHFLINCAAYTDVDGSEENYKRAFLVNGFGVRNLAISSSKYGFHLIHFSTNYVFDGKKGRPYLEFDITNPINAYGESKFSGEKEIYNHLNDFTIIRISWLYGRSGNDFPKRLLERAKKRERIEVVDDMYCSPTSVRVVGDAVKFIIMKKLKGIFHSSCEGYCTFYEYALILKDIFNFSSEIVPISSRKLTYIAKRPKFCILESFLLKREGFKTPHFKDELIDFFKTYDKI